MNSARHFIGGGMLQLRSWPPRRWRIAGWWFLGSFLAMGIAGETLPGASLDRAVPVQWWNYVTLILSPALIGLCAATFAVSEPRRSRLPGATGAGISGVISTVAMACPVCSPLAIPIFGSAGVLSFLEPERGLIALLSIVLLVVTLGLRLRAEQHCQLAQQPSQDMA
ncbi:MAG: hypothetical protein ACRDK2_00625, partial [Solirubrobacteraceae bacterium]